MKAFILYPHEIQCHTTLFNKMRVLERKMSSCEYSFLCHTLYSFMVQMNKEDGEWIEIHSKTIEKYLPSFRRKNRENLINKGFLRYDKTFQKGKKAFYYSPGIRLLGIIQEAFTIPFSTMIEEGFCTLGGKKNLISQKNKKEKKIPMIRYNCIDYISMQEMESCLHQQTQTCRNKIKKQKLMRKILQNTFCLSQIITRNFQCHEEGTATYVPYYVESTTGRLYEKGGGMQMVSREMKHAAYSCLSNVYNYDLRSSQLSILLELSQRYGGFSKESFLCLSSYVCDKNAKYKYAQQVGISVDLWKKSLLALLFGSSFSSYGKIWIYVKEWVEEGKTKNADVNSIIENLKIYMRPFEKIKQEWVEILSRNFLRHKKKILYNDQKKKFIVRENTPEEQRIFSAFLLQGLESCFIRKIIALSDEYGYDVYANEHDGLIVHNKIPRAAVEKAKRETGFSSAQLEIKPLL